MTIMILESDLTNRVNWHASNIGPNNIVLFIIPMVVHNEKAHQSSDKEGNSGER